MCHMRRHLRKPGLVCHSDALVDIECTLGTKFAAFQVFSLHTFAYSLKGSSRGIIFGELWLS